ncbi:MAG: nitrate reductase molybdenum cofactor assembly chaperone [Tannerellaceae bacterium]
MAKVLKLVSLLLDYPTSNIQALMPSFKEVVDHKLSLDSKSRKRLNDFIDHYQKEDLLTWQQEYTQVFDYSPATSLYLFDHVYGDSRQRGMAMVNLKMMYEDEGLHLSDAELPDYLPVFLEFLGETQTEESACNHLAEVKEVVEKITKSLKEGNSKYAELLEIILALASRGVATPFKAVTHSDEIKKACDGCLLNEQRAFINE